MKKIVLIMILLLVSFYAYSQDDPFFKTDSTENYVIYKNSIDEIMIDIQYQGKSRNVMILIKDASYMDCVRYLTNMKFKENSLYRSWTKGYTAAYILWDWDEHYWFISVYEI